MKRDTNLIREILLVVEESINDLHSSGMEFEGHTRSQIDYNIELLWDAGWVKGIDARSMVGFELMNMQLTWEGHDFLDNIRDEGIWAKVVDKLKSVSGTASLEVIKGIAVEAIKQQLGLE